MKKTEHFVFVDKKLDKKNELTNVSIYGSIRELWRKNQDIINYSEGWLRTLLTEKNNHLETNDFCIKKCEVQRSKMLNLKN